MRLSCRAPGRPAWQPLRAGAASPSHRGTAGPPRPASEEAPARRPRPHQGRALDSHCQLHATALALTPAACAAPRSHPCRARLCRGYPAAAHQGRARQCAMHQAARGCLLPGGVARRRRLRCCKRARQRARGRPVPPYRSVTALPPHPPPPRPPQCRRRRHADGPHTRRRRCGDAD